MKKGLSLFLSLIMVLGVLTSIPLTVNAASGSEIVAYARQFIGYPYVWGTQGPDSFDCSGFVQYVFKHFGISLPASSSSYWNNPEDYGTVIATGTTANAQAGDLISWSGHIAIYTENGYCVEALNPTYGVCEKFKVDSHTNGLNYKVIRVNGVENYTEPPAAPQNVRTSTGTNLFTVNDYITFYWDTSFSATDYWIYMWKDGEQIYATDMGNNTSFTAAPASAGKYTLIVRAGNSYGYSNGPASVDFVIYDSAPSAPKKIWGEKTKYSSEEYFTIYWDSVDIATEYWVYMWKDGKQIYQTNMGNSTSITSAPTSPGKYTVIIRAGNAFGYSNDPCSFDFTVYDPNEKFTITYNANGGSGAPSSQTKTYGQTLTLSSTKPTRSEYTFLGWSTSSTATKATYSAGGSFTANVDTTLYAVWQKNHSHSYTGTVTKAPTCTESGVKTFKCSCGTSYTQSISATGHIAGSWEIDKKATVNAAGSKHKECTECGEVLETAEIPQLKCSKPTLKSIENSEYGVLVKWGTVKGADKYYIYRKVKGGSYSRIGSTTNTYYTDKTAKSGKKYYYIVKAINEAGASSSSSALSKLYLADPTLKTPTSTKSGVSLKWTKTAGAEGYIIYRKTGSGSYTKLKTEKGVSNLSYVDKSAKKGKKYTYKVKAYYSKTYSAYSNTKSITDKY